MNVTLDISVLGRGHHDPRSRAGIFRVVENLAMGLADSPRCELSFSAIHSFRSLYESFDYLRATPALGHVPLPSTRRTRLLRYGQSDVLEARIAASRYPRTALLRARRKFYSLIRRSMGDPTQPVDAHALTHADVFHSPFYALPAAVLGAAHLQKFLTVHDIIPMLFPYLFNDEIVGSVRESLRDLERVDWIIAVSQSTKNDLCNHLPTLDPSRVIVIHNAAAGHLGPCADTAERAAVRKKYQIPDAPYLLSLGTLEPRKNLDQLIRCFSALVEAERIHDLNLVLVGTRGWLYEKIFDAAQLANSIRQRIYFTGYVDDADLSAVYSGAQAFVYPSLYEGFGLPPLEAMQCGVPVITSNTSAFPEVIGDAGMLVDPRDADAMSQAMLTVCSSDAVRAELSAKSIARARQFSWETATQKTLDAYEVAMGTRRAAVT